MNPVDLNDAQIFVKVIESGSFSATARVLAIPKATVSRRVARLEESLGALLLHRTTRKLELTTLGRQYFEDVSRGLAILETAESRLAAAHEDSTGLLRVSAPVGFGTRTLVGWIQEYLDIHTRVRIELILDDQPRDLVTSRIDVAFRTSRISDSGYVEQKLQTTRLILVASPTYLQRRGVPETIEQLGNHDCVLFGSSAESDVWRLEGPEGLREIPVSGRIAVNGSHAELHASLVGLGIALLPLALLVPYLRQSELVQVLPDYGLNRGQLSIAHVRNRYMPATLRSFLDFVISRAATSEQ